MRPPFTMCSESLAGIRNMKPPFSMCSESLAGIINGMDICNTDDVLTVCISGDQAFAMLEYAKSVAAVDIEPQQIEYVIHRKKAIKKRDIKAFLSVDKLSPWLFGHSIIERRDAYFLQEGRLKRIKENIGRLELKIGDLMQMPKERDRFSKIYLSNVLDYTWGFKSGTVEDKNICTAYLENAAKMLREPGIIYVTSHALPSDAIKEILPANLRIDEKLTAIARTDKTPYWVPTVLRREA